MIYFITVNCVVGNMELKSSTETTGCTINGRKSVPYVLKESENCLRISQQKRNSGHMAHVINIVDILCTLSLDEHVVRDIV